MTKSEQAIRVEEGSESEKTLASVLPDRKELRKQYSLLIYLYGNYGKYGKWKISATT